MKKSLRNQQKTPHFLYFTVNGLDNRTVEIRMATQKEIDRLVHPPKDVGLIQCMSFTTYNPLFGGATMVFILPNEAHMDYNVLVALIDRYLEITAENPPDEAGDIPYSLS